jgi:hypothetical protein
MNIENIRTMDMITTRIALTSRIRLELRAHVNRFL